MSAVISRTMLSSSEVARVSIGGKRAASTVSVLPAGLLDRVPARP